MEIRLRAPEPGDLDLLYLWENDPFISRYGSAVAPFSRAMLWEYISNYDADPFHAGQLRLMVESDGETVGCVDLYDIDGKNRRAFVGIVIDAAHRGRGIGHAALEQLWEYSSETLNLHQIAAVVPVLNVRSTQLFCFAGYKEIALLPQWVRLGREFADARLMVRSI